MSLVEEEDELRLIEIADLGELVEQLVEHPKQSCRVEARVVHELIGGEDIDHAIAVADAHEVVDVEGRLAEELVGALLFQDEQSALQHADGLRSNVAVLAAQLTGTAADLFDHR